MPDPIQTKNIFRVSGLTQGSPSPEEIRTLLLHWQLGENTSQYARRVREEGILVKKTATRTAGVVELFKAWFETPDHRAARWLQFLAQKNLESRVLNEMIFLYKSRRETILAAFTLEKFWPVVRQGELYLQNQAVMEFIREAQENGKTSQDLTESTVIHLARGIVASLLSVGFLREEKRNLRELIPYRVSDLTIAYLAHDYHFADLSDLAVVEHPEWGIFGLNRAEVLERLSELDKKFGMVVQHAGAVVRITWMYSTMEEMLDASTD